MEKAKKIITKLTEKVMGYINPKNGEITYALNVKKGNNLIPFYFDPNKKKLIFPLEKEEEGLNYAEKAFNAIVAVPPDEVIDIQKFVSNKDEYFEKFKKVFDFYEKISTAPSMMYSELTVFKFPRSLLDTFHQFPLSEYESCGAIIITKFQSIEGERGSIVKYSDLEEKDVESEMDYAVLFNSSKTHECSHHPYFTRREIFFHNHPIKYRGNTSIMKEFVSAVHELIGPPSIADLILIINKLITGRIDIDLIFSYGGVYVSKRNKTLNPEKYLYLTDDEIEATDNHIELRRDFIRENEYKFSIATYKIQTEIAIMLLKPLPEDEQKIKEIREINQILNKIAITRGIISSLKEREEDNISKINYFKKENDEIEKIYKNISLEKVEELDDFIREKLRKRYIDVENIISNSNLNSYALFISRCNECQQKMKELIKLYEDMLNPPSMSLLQDEKIKLFHLPVEVINIKDGFDVISYPQFSVEVYPRLTTNILPPEIRRLSMRSS